MKPSEILVAARALIERPEAWTKEAQSRSVYGTEVVAQTASAVCWCSVGAIIKAAAHSSLYNDLAARDIVRKVIGSDYITAWNDAPERTHTEVLDAFTKAITLAREAGQ